MCIFIFQFPPAFTEYQHEPGPELGVFISAFLADMVISILVLPLWPQDIPTLTFPPKLNRLFGTMLAWYHPTTPPAPPWVLGPGG